MSPLRGLSRGALALAWPHLAVLLGLRYGLAPLRAAAPFVFSKRVENLDETEIKPYDIVAIIPIVAGAGGMVTTWENGPAQSGGRIIVASDRRVHRAALEILNS